MRCTPGEIEGSAEETSGGSSRRIAVIVSGAVSRSNGRSPASIS
jgi:hypothetical protein